MSKLKVLFVGESAIVHSTEHKGNNTFTGTRYSEPGLIMEKILTDEGHDVTRMPCHRVHIDFPDNIDDLMEYDCLVISDIGTDSFLLHPDTMRFSERTPNKLKVIEEFVRNGKGLMMVGGYMTFAGIDGKGKYHGTIIEEVLPVNVYTFDDRVEVPEGADLKADPESHEILNGLPREWPYILGYNKLVAKEGSQVLVEHNGDPIITVGNYGKGRALAYATDCTPHWAPPTMYKWEYYGQLWTQMLNWIAGK